MERAQNRVPRFHFLTRAAQRSLLGTFRFTLSLHGGLFTLVPTFWMEHPHASRPRLFSTLCFPATHSVFTGLCARHAVWRCLPTTLCFTVCVYATLFVWLCLVRMVQRIKEIVAHYEESLRKMPSVPRYSYGRVLLRRVGAPNRNFLTYLFRHQEPAITHHVTAVTTHK
jgi:hypothetical protein